VQYSKTKEEGIANKLKDLHRKSSDAAKRKTQGHKLNDKQITTETPKDTVRTVASKCKPLPDPPIHSSKKNLSPERSRQSSCSAVSSAKPITTVQTKTIRDSSVERNAESKPFSSCTKPLPALPTNKPPPKPPRTFASQLNSDSRKDSLYSESEDYPNFDPVTLPRQDGDGQESEEYSNGSCRSADNYTSSSHNSSDHRTYSSPIPAEHRPYTSLTHTEDGEYDSENAYDTLGRCSAHSSSTNYDQYDTISQSELDCDVSRPPTLPRRPSNLHRHRPLTTAFSHLDISHSMGREAKPATITEASPTGTSPTKMKVPFKLKYLLPKARRKSDEMRKASSMACLVDESLYDDVEFSPSEPTPSTELTAVSMDEAGYALPDIRVSMLASS